MPDIDFIHRFVPGEGGPATRTLLLLHGTGGNENEMIPLGRELDGRAALLSLRGKVLENGMPRFFRRLAEGVFDEEDLIRRTHQVADFVETGAKRYQFDPQQGIAVGYSNGANMAAAMMLLRPKVLAGAVLFRAMVPLLPSVSPNLADVRVLLLAGQADPFVPVDNSERLAALLRTGGAAVTLRFEAPGHGLTPEDLAIARRWLGEDANGN
jgi:predicted esterase